ncbi:MAG TPA: ABC transporter permease [Anaerolineae bacterium]
MRNIWIVIKHEIKVTIGKSSFWLTTFLLPAVIIALSAGSQLLARSSLAEGGDSPFSAKTSSNNKADIGYVDEAGLIKQIPDRIEFGAGGSVFVVSPDRLRKFSDRASAQAALEAGDLLQYYIVAADFFKSGNLTLVDRNFSLFTSLDSSGFFEYIINYNLAGNENLAKMLSNPIKSTTTRQLAPKPARDPKDALTTIVPLAALFIFYFVLTMTSQFMLQSVTKEKENRTAEVLLLSLRPRDLMLGKVVGLGFVALLQVGIWAAVGLTGLNTSGADYILPEGFLVWGILYFVLGYLLYGSVFAALGALAPNTREGSQFTFIALLPLMLPLFLSNAFAQSPNDALPVVLSLFPLTSPTSMITRLSAASVPIEQLLIGLVLLAATTYLFVLLSARFFRADTLLSGDSLNFRRLIREFRQKAA